MNTVLRRAEGGWFHWCPGCQHHHRLPDTWTFNGNVEQPTFTPSFKHTWGNGRCCHYTVTNGQLHFCGDCTHALAGQTVPMPVPPDGGGG